MIIHYGRRTAEVDDAGYLVGITVEHHRVHDGNMFCATHVFEGAGTGSGPANRFMVRPSAAGSYVHLFLSVSTNKEVLVKLLENPATSSSGTKLTCYNRNRNSSTTATCSAFYGSGLSGSPGTVLWEDRFGGSDANPRNAGAAEGNGRAQEWILNPSYNYLVLLNPEAADTNVSVAVEFYEDSMWHD